MTFKEFVTWCSDRACDGRWGIAEATICANVIQAIRRHPFWRREKVWEQEYRQNISAKIIDPVNNKIAKSA